MTAFRDLAGQQFGRWHVEDFAGFRHFRSGDKTQWNCVCVCGSVAIVQGGNLTSGISTSCGCYKAELSRERISFNRNPEKTAHANFHKKKTVLGCKYCESKEATNMPNATLEANILQGVTLDQIQSRQPEVQQEVRRIFAHNASILFPQVNQVPVTDRPVPCTDEVAPFPRNSDNQIPNS